MKSTELRIGNWYQWYDGDEWVDTHVATGSDIDLAGSLKKVHRPIPLDVKQLYKLGFSAKMGSVCHTHSFIKGMVIIGTPLRSPMHYNGLELKHVHQLQNLYFGLTGEEL